jgi:hypothetical protein
MLVLEILGWLVYLLIYFLLDLRTTSFVYFLGGGSRAGTQDLALTRKVLYYLNHPLGLFGFSYF